MTASAFAPRLTEQGRVALDTLLAKTVTERRLPALFLAVCNAEEVLYEKQGGSVDFEHPEAGEVDENTTLHLFSMTKLVTSIACHQLVDRGLASMDDPEVVAKYCPELALDKLEIIEGFDEGGQPKMRKAKTPITLRMLLTHNAGMCYPWLCPPNVEEWRTLNGKPSLIRARGETSDYVQPLVYEPGTSYCYSISLDWAGFFVERVTGQSLEEYFQENIFKPCGMSSTSFLPTKEIKDRLMKPCMMDPETHQLSVLHGSAMGKPTEPEDVTLFLGGAGLHGTTRDYLKLLQAILRSSPSNPSPPSNPLISKESFNALFTGALPPASPANDALEKLAGMMLRQTYQRPGGPPTLETVQHSPGLAIYLEDGEFGRKKGSGAWSGVFKTFFWVDPTTGIAAQCNTNVSCPSNDNAIGQTFNAFERTLYRGLA